MKTGPIVEVSGTTAVSAKGVVPGKQASIPRYQFGDRIEYVPHVCHAFNCNGNNEYPWVIGQKQPPRAEQDPVTGEIRTVEHLVELDEGRLHRNVLPFVSQAPDAADHSRRLVPLRPVKPWPAVVRQVHDDGTLDLDIESNIGVGMVTLHYDRVPVEESGQMPHSCRKGGA